MFWTKLSKIPALATTVTTLATAAVTLFGLSDTICDRAPTIGAKIPLSKCGANAVRVERPPDEKPSLKGPSPSDTPRPEAIDGQAEPPPGAAIPPRRTEENGCLTVPAHPTESIPVEAGQRLCSIVGDQIRIEQIEKNRIIYSLNGGWDKSCEVSDALCAFEFQNGEQMLYRIHIKEQTSEPSRLAAELEPVQRSYGMQGGRKR